MIRLAGFLPCVLQPSSFSVFMWRLMPSQCAANGPSSCVMLIVITLPFKKLDTACMAFYSVSKEIIKHNKMLYSMV